MAFAANAAAPSAEAAPIPPPPAPSAAVPAAEAAVAPMAEATGAPAGETGAAPASECTTFAQLLSMRLELSNLYQSAQMSAVLVSRVFSHVLSCVMLNAACMYVKVQFSPSFMTSPLSSHPSP